MGIDMSLEEREEGWCGEERLKIKIINFLLENMK